MSSAFDVFLCHNGDDKAAVISLGNQLKQREINVWLDVWELTPGRPWIPELESLIDKVRSVAVLIGNSGIGPWQAVEMRAFLSESVSKGLPIIPVLLPEAPVDVSLPYFIRAYTWVDCREGLSNAAIDRLVWGITGRKPASCGATESAATVESRTPRSVCVTSRLNQRGGEIPFKRFRKGGYKHYHMQISLAAEKVVLDAVADVEYQLHPSFKQPRRISTDRESNFAIDIWTYGGFELEVLIRFVDGTTVKKTHALELNLPENNGFNYVDVSRPGLAEK